MKKILKVKRGDTIVIPVQVFTDTGAVMNTAQITNAFFTVKKKRGDLDSVALIAKSLGSGITVVDASLGKLQVTINPIDTSMLSGYLRGLPWDVQVVTVSGAVYTVADGLMVIEPDVTRGT